MSRHFAPVGVSTPRSGEDYLRYYRESADRYQKFSAENPSAKALPLTALRIPCQIEKDERFWTAACWLQIYYCEQRTRVLAELMRRCFGDRPPFTESCTWADCLNGDLHLYFEAHLPSPGGYKRWLREHLRARNLIPYVLRAAMREGNRDFEGATHADAMLINASNGFAALIEAKVLSDISCQVSFDVARNQIARTLDVMLDKHPRLEPPLCSRDPEKTLFIFQSPAIFKANPHTRLYGWLLENYRAAPSAICRDLPHRSRLDCGSLSARIGWLTWEDCENALPGSCKWLAREANLQAPPRETFQPKTSPQTTIGLPYAFNAGFDRKLLDSLLAEFESSVRRDVDWSLPRRLRRELLESTPPSVSHRAVLQLAKWCNTDSPLYADGMDAARKISTLLFGCVVDRKTLNV